jgi:hypothetical protein
MAYNLPPPWDPGFALPDNVRDEGLERRGFVTKQMPRGTYDQPNVGTGGYAVPEYVMDEGYGQGTFTTKWEPRGTYDGGRIPNWLNQRPKVLAERKIRGRTRETTIAFPMAVMPYNEGSAVAMSGVDDLPTPFADYGKRAAVAILSRVQSLPQDKRKIALKQIMDALDPTLWTRTAKLARQNLAAGMSAAQALREGLALALGSGIAAEMVQAGLNRQPPKPHSLLGLGCYGPRIGLGQTGTVAMNLLTAPDVQTMTLQTAALIPLVMCAGYTYVAAAGAVPAHWERSRAHLGIPDQPGPARSGCPGTETNLVRTGSGQVVAPVIADPTLKIGLWRLSPVEGQRISYSWSIITPEQGAQLISWIRKAYESMRGITGFFKFGIEKKVSLESVGLAPSKVEVYVGLTNGNHPITTFKHPTTGKLNGVYVTAVGTKEKPRFSLAWRYEPTPSEAAWKFFNEIIHRDEVEGLIKDVVKGVVAIVSDEGCKVAQNPLAKPAAAVVGGFYGGPPGAAAGTAGADIAKGACAGPPPQELPPGGGGEEKGSSMLPLALIGGGVVLAAILLSRKKTP